jgi:hypothetical protein
MLSACNLDQATSVNENLEMRCAQVSRKEIGKFESGPWSDNRERLRNQQESHELSASDALGAEGHLMCA